MIPCLKPFNHFSMHLDRIHTPYSALRDPCLFLLLWFLQLFIISHFSPCSLRSSHWNRSGSDFIHTVPCPKMLVSPVLAWLAITHYSGLSVSVNFLRQAFLETFSLCLPYFITVSCCVYFITLCTICSYIFGCLLSLIQQIFIGYLLRSVWCTVVNITHVVSVCLFH